MSTRGSRRRAARGLVVAAAAVASLAFASTASADNYLVLYKSEAVPASAKADIEQAGGTLLQGYDQIGVAVAKSDSASFAAKLGADNRVEGVSSTKAFATKLDDPAGDGSADAEGPPPGGLPNAPASDSDSLSPLQWDMRQMDVPAAHAVTGGSPAVVAGDIDSGLDPTHPDLAQNVDYSRSVSCADNGVPDQDPAAWKDDNGHGTHTAGTIAAAANGFGIVGVAPNVKIAAIKASTPDGFFYPENVVCSFVWAGTHGIDVTNNSYFADPYLYNCRNDQTQHAIWKAEQRAIRFAMNQGVTVVAAAGNESDDLSHPGVDTTSPDDQTPQTREVTNACVTIPVEIPGVIGVSADSHTQQQDDDPSTDPNYLKAYYSSYGVSAVDVVAPGGDFYFGRTPESPNGLVLSTWPSYKPCSRSVQEPPTPTAPTAVYCYLQGTSMASPHVAGEAALIVSRYGDASNPQNGKLRPGQVKALIDQTADPQPCPTSLPTSTVTSPPTPYSAVTQTSGEPQECQGGTGHNSWYGNGQANAFNAVTHVSGATG